MISFVVPAFNEEGLLPACLDSIVHSVGIAAPDEPYEIVVVNDASTDATREVGLAHGAKVVDVELRQIAGVRNAGARVGRILDRAAQRHGPRGVVGHLAQQAAPAIRQAGRQTSQHARRSGAGNR